MNLSFVRRQKFLDFSTCSLFIPISQNKKNLQALNLSGSFLKAFFILERNLKGEIAWQVVCLKTCESGIHPFLPTPVLKGEFIKSAPIWKCCLPQKGPKWVTRQKTTIKWTFFKAIVRPAWLSWPHVSECVLAKV